MTATLWSTLLQHGTLPSNNQLNKSQLGQHWKTVSLMAYIPVLQVSSGASFEALASCLQTFCMTPKVSTAHGCISCFYDMWHAAIHQLLTCSLLASMFGIHCLTYASADVC